MQPLAAELDALVDTTSFSGVVRLTRAGAVEYERAAGDADRERGRPNRVSTQFGTASMTKTFTALTVMSRPLSGLQALAGAVAAKLDPARPSL